MYMPKIIECIYEDGVFKPLEKVELKEGERVRIILRKSKREILDKYAGTVKLGKVVKIEDVLELEGEAWLY